MAEMDIPRLTKLDAQDSKKLLKNMEDLTSSINFLGDSLLGIKPQAGTRLKSEARSLAAKGRARGAGGKFLSKDIKEQVDATKKNTEELKKSSKNEKEKKKKEDGFFKKAKTLASEYGKFFSEGLLGDISFLTEPFKRIGGLFKKTMEFLAPTKKIPPKRSAMLKSHPFAVYIVDELTGKKKLKTGEEFAYGLTGLTGIAAQLFPALMKVLPLAAIAGGIIWGVIDGIATLGKAEEWGVNKVAAFMAGFFAGQGAGWENAKAMALKTGLMGAGVGMLAGGPVGAIVGLLVGAVVGGILGYIGSAKIAVFIDQAMTEISWLFEDLFGGIIWTVTRLVKGIGILFKSKEEQEAFKLEGLQHIVDLAKRKEERTKKRAEDNEATFQRMHAAAIKAKAEPGTDVYERSARWYKTKEQSQAEYEKARTVSTQAQKRYDEVASGKSKAGLLESMGVEKLSTGEKLGALFGIFGAGIWTIPLMKLGGAVEDMIRDALSGGKDAQEGQDFISRPGSPMIKMNPNDTLIAAKTGLNITNDETNSLLKISNDLMRELIRKTQKEVHAISHTSIESGFNPSKLSTQLAAPVI